MMLAGVGGAQSNLNLAVSGGNNPLTIAQKDLKMAYVPKRKNNNIRFKRLTSQSNHENKLTKLHQSTMMLQNFNTNAQGNNQSTSSRDSIPLPSQVSVASAQFIQKNS